MAGDFGGTALGLGAPVVTASVHDERDTINTTSSTDLSQTERMSRIRIALVLFRDDFTRQDLETVDILANSTQPETASSPDTEPGRKSNVKRPG
jgi:hypothetical protein